MDNQLTPAPPEPQQELTEQELSELLQIRRDKLAALQAAGKDPFEVMTFDQTHHSQDIVDGFEALEGQTVRIAGRMMSKRIMGKASFAHILDGKGTVQAYIRRDDVRRGCLC
jgi:lysyl-tRNA synthetase class 2